jgi:hypothetical protein
MTLLGGRPIRSHFYFLLDRSTFVGGWKPATAVLLAAREQLEKHGCGKIK